MAQIGDDIFKTRIAINERAINPVIDRGISFQESLEEGDTDKLENDYNEFMEALDNFSFDLRRQRSIRKRIALDTEYYKKKLSIEGEMETVKREIENLHEEYKNEISRRKNLEEYEKMAALINKYSSREESMEEISRLEKELETAREDVQKRLDELRFRKTQLSLLINCIYNVEADLEQEFVPASKSTQNNNDITSGTQEVVSMDE